MQDKTLKDYPHINNTIDNLWGTMRFYEYIDSLLVQSREERNGFPFAVLNEIIDIRDKHKEEFYYLNKPTDIWENR